MSENRIKERITRNEERIRTIFSTLERIEDNQIRYENKTDKALDVITTQLRISTNEQYHELIDKIERSERVKRRPWGRLEWTAIITTIILTLGNIIIKLLEGGIWNA